MPVCSSECKEKAAKFKDKNGPNYSPNDDPSKNSPNSDKIAQLKADIETLKKYLSDPNLTEKEKVEVQEKLSRFEKELALLENQSNSNPNQLPSPKDKDNHDNSSSNDKDKKIKDLETEISQLKNNNKNETPQQQEETKKKIAEKEQE